MPSRELMTRGELLVPATRPAKDFTLRLVAFHPEAFVPLETPYILWYRQSLETL